MAQAWRSTLPTAYRDPTSERRRATSSTSRTSRTSLTSSLRRAPRASPSMDGGSRRSPRTRARRARASSARGHPCHLRSLLSPSATATAWWVPPTTLRRFRTSARARSSFSSARPSSAAPTWPYRLTTRACRFPTSMRFRPGPQRRSTGRAISVWVIALLVALVATVQIRSQAEVERSLVGIDTTSLAFLIDDLHRANDSLQAEAADLQSRQATLRSGTSGAADHGLHEQAYRLRAHARLRPLHG